MTLAASHCNLPLNFLLCYAAGTLHDGSASSDRAEAGSPRDN